VVTLYGNLSGISVAPADHPQMRVLAAMVVTVLMVVAVAVAVAEPLADAVVTAEMEL
jgi:hypothetical protein